MSFLLKQALNSLTSETSDIQAALSLKADAIQTYAKTDTYFATEVDAKFTNLIASAPATLNTLNSLSDDSSFASTVAKNLASKAPLDSPTCTGTVTGITQSMVGLSNVNNTADALKPS